MRHRVPIHAYRLVYPDSPHGPELLWEWEEPYITHLLWNAKTGTFHERAKVVDSLPGYTSGIAGCRHNLSV
jgi:hypothetical protein